MKHSIALVCMTKNGRGRIGHLLGSCIGLVDKAYIFDTGSTDGTVSYLRTAPITPYPVFTLEGTFTDFASSRNAGLQWAREDALKTADQTWLLLLDDDMVLKESQPGAFAELKAQLSSKPLFDSLLLRHQETPEYWITRLVRAELDWNYVGVTHEYLNPTRLFGRAEQLHILHNHNHGPAKFNRDLQMLTADIARDPNDARTIFYLAQTLKCLGQEEASARFYVMRAQMGGWREEVYVALWESARMTKSEGLMEKAYEYRPQRAEAPAWLAQNSIGADKRQKWEDIRATIPLPTDILFVVKQCYGPTAPNL